MTSEKLLKKILNSQTNVRFSEFVKLVEAFGFTQVRQNGSHHIYSSPESKEFLNLQEVRGQAKPYQIKQFIALIEKYGIRLSK